MYRSCFIQRLGVFIPRMSNRIVSVKGGSRWFSSQNETMAKSSEKNKVSWRENPNTKYWVIGITAITAIIYRYIYKEKNKKKLVVKNYPALPNHKVQRRNADVDELYKLYTNLKSSFATILLVEGHGGAGKTQLAREFAEKLVEEEEKRYHFLPQNLFVGTINAASLETLMFDMKKFAVAIGCQTKDWMDRLEEGSSFAALSNDEQLHVIVEAVKEKLVANPNWILIIDNLKEETLLQNLLNEEEKSCWGKGTVIITGQKKTSLNLVNTYSIEKGMDESEAFQLLQDLSDLPEDKEEGIQTVVSKLAYSPLAIACAGNYVKSRFSTDPQYSMETFSEELNSGILKLKEANRNNSQIDEHELMSYVMASLMVKETIASSPHFLHTFDLIGSCASDWPIPVTLVSLHLRSPEFHLPPVPRSISVLPKLSEQAGSEPLQTKPGEDVEESFLSIKRIANNLESFTTSLKANYDAIKEMFYPPTMDIPPPVDGVLDLMRTCPLITVDRVDPGGVETLRVNPIVHDVMSQLFFTITAPLLEDQYLLQAEEKHNKSSWFRRLWKFDPQRVLQEYRNSLGEHSSDKSPVQECVLDVHAVPRDVDVSVLLKDETNNENHEELQGYRIIQPAHAVCHYQHHVSLGLETINGVSSVCSQDVQTRTLARLLKPHLDHILTTSTSKSLGPKSRAHALSAVASINSALGNLESSIPSLRRAIEIEEQQFGNSSLEVAVTLTRLAEVYSSLEDAARARELLERSLGIYDLQRKKSGEYKKPLEFARAMEALGAVYGTLGFKQRSKEYIERALSYMQAAAPMSPGEIEGRRFACEVASTLTDLGHAYLSVGDAFSGRKMLELAVTGLKNMYGEEHPEVVRAMTVLGIAYTMQGNWQEGRKMRKEAGKLQTKIDAVVAL